MEQRMNRAITAMQGSGIRRVAEEARTIEDCISLTLGEPAFDTPQPIREAAKRALDANETHYPPNAGLCKLRDSIALYEGIYHHRTLTHENVVVTCGSTEALACAMLATLEPGDEVIVPVPAFGLYAQQIQMARGVCVPLETANNRFQIDMDALQSKITPRTKAIVLNSPNNPTGTIYSQASIDAVTEVCLRHNLFLIFDAVYDRLIYREPMPYPSEAKLGSRLIVCNAFSKPYAMTGWRVGYCIAAQEVVRELIKVHAALTVGVSTFSQVACFDIHAVPIGHMLDEYQANRDFVYEKLCAMGIDVVLPEGAFYAFPSIQKYGMDDETFVHRLMHEAKLALVPGTCFGAPGYVRISYCCARETLAQGLGRLAHFLKSL